MAEREGHGGTIPMPMPRLSFATMLEKLYADKHTGPVVVHFAQGSPNVIEIPCEPTRISLDSGKKRPQS